MNLHFYYFFRPSEIGITTPDSVPIPVSGHSIISVSLGISHVCISYDSLVVRDKEIAAQEKEQ
jgi:hypothetical protein